jgi:glycosyltransferase involved in cell wall biosynthesis
MKIGVIFQGSLHAGGSFQQSISACKVLYANTNNREFVFFADESKNLVELEKHGIRAHLFKLSRLDRLIHKLRKNLKIRSFIDRFNAFKPFDHNFEKHQVDLLYFTAPSGLSLFLERLNYIITVWDLCHRDFPEFPEVRTNLEFEHRENFFKQTLPKAIAVIAESQLGRDNIIRRYAIDPERIHCIPLSPAIHSEKNYNTNYDPRSKTGVPKDEPFIFYPAQFWPHKNHILILEAISLLLKENKLKIHAFFCGSDCGNLEFILESARRLKVDHLVHYLGFITDEEIIGCYKNSLALIMPSYFGPTNIPPLEAFALGTPAIVANLPGIRTQVSGVGITVDPDNPDELRNSIRRLHEDCEWRDSLIRKGIEKSSKDCDTQRLDVLDSIISSYERTSKTWSHSQSIKKKRSGLSN